MKKYLVLRTNHGFQGKMWMKDQEVQFEDDIEPPHHFQLLDGGIAAKKAVEAVKIEKEAYSQIQTKAVKPLPTAGSVLKSQKKSSSHNEEF